MASNISYPFKIKKLFGIFLFSIFAMLSGGIASCKEHSSLEVLSIKQSVDEKYKKHPDAAFCNNFNMTDSEVLNFFRKAKTITKNEKNYQYYWSPCSVIVSIKNVEDVYKWKIYASGVAEEVSDDDNLLGCKDCGEPFFNFYDENN